jgi:hypothetical protein
MRSTDLEIDRLEHYVTLFDSAFLPQGIALHASLSRHGNAFTLWVLCMDEEAKATLDSLGKPNLKTLALSEVETPELLAVKPGRNRAEYCWTLTPFTPKLVFDRDPTAGRVTYVDSDVFLLKSPQPIFEEFERSKKAVLITDHAYDAEYDQSARSGQYCVQFMTFVRGSSEPVRQWWADRCIEWCFDRIEDGKLGDQKYLDDWLTRFPTLVHVLCQLDAILAPWNARRFPYSRAIAWHFHGLRLLSKNRVLLHRGYVIPDVVDKVIYASYIQELRNSLTAIGRPIVQNVTGRDFRLRTKFFLKTVLSSIRRLYEHDSIADLPE